MQNHSERIDRLKSILNRPGTPWLILAAGMVISTGLAMWFGRHASFSVDEYSWLSASPQLDLNGALKPHVGHLILIPRLVYKLIFSTLGTGYLPFRLLTLASVFTSVGLLFAWGKRRVPAYVALAPCLVLLVFPADIWHYLAGNGYSVVLPVGVGIGALLAFEREDRTGDIGAFLLLMFGIATYSNALPFAAGIALVALIQPGGRKRSWVGLVPLVLYLIWKVHWGSGDGGEGGGVDPANILLLPAWTFESLSGILAALAGLNFDFTTGSTVKAGAMFGPVLALLGIAGLWWRISKTRLTRPLVLVLAIMLALFAIQALVWSHNVGRGPADPRYLYPGAIIVVLVGLEAVRGMNFTRNGYLAIWAVAGVSLMTSGGLLVNNTEWLGDWADQARSDITASTLAYETGHAPPMVDQPRQRLLEDFNPGTAESYGYLGLTVNELADAPGWQQDWVDDYLAKTFDSTLVRKAPTPAPAWCRKVAAPAKVDRGTSGTYPSRLYPLFADPKQALAKLRAIPPC